MKNNNNALHPFLRPLCHSTHPLRHSTHPLRHSPHPLRHSRAGGNPVSLNIYTLDPRLRGDDAEVKKNNAKVKRASTTNLVVTIIMASFLTACTTPMANTNAQSSTPNTAIQNTKKTNTQSTQPAQSDNSLTGTLASMQELINSANKTVSGTSSQIQSTQRTFQNLSNTFG